MLKAKIGDYVVFDNLIEIIRKYIEEKPSSEDLHMSSKLVKFLLTAGDKKFKVLDVDDDGYIDIKEMSEWIYPLCIKEIIKSEKSFKFKPGDSVVLSPLCIKEIVEVERSCECKAGDKADQEEELKAGDTVFAWDSEGVWRDREKMLGCLLSIDADLDCKYPYKVFIVEMGEILFMQHCELI